MSRTLRLAVGFSVMMMTVVEAYRYVETEQKTGNVILNVLECTSTAKSVTRKRKKPGRI
nr:hypothetical protein [Sphingobacterium phlebotomi]